MARGRVLTDTRLAGRVWFFTGAKYRPIRLLTVISFRTAGRLAALTVLAIVLFAPAARASSAHAAGELVVRYRAGTTSDERDQIRAAAGVESAGTIDGETQRVRVTASQTVGEAAASLRSDDRVVHALPNYVAKMTAFQPNDPGRGSGWANLQWNFIGPFGINLPTAWDNAIAAGAPGGENVVVAVLDTGVAYRTSADRRYLRAPDLERSRFVQGRDFIRGNNLPYDRNGHGTFVAGLISQSTNNGIGVTGVAYRSKVMPVRVLDHEGKGDVATIARGIRFASRRGARVINMSFEFDSGLTASQIPDVISALRYANRKGVLLVAAAGNTEDQRVAYPARRAQRPRGRRHDRARLPGRLLEHRLRARPGRTRRRCGRVGGGRRQLPSARGTGPLRLPVHVPRNQPAQVRPAAGLRGNFHGRAACGRDGRARDRRRRCSATGLRRPPSRSGSPRLPARWAPRDTTRSTAGACWTRARRPRRFRPSGY